MENNEPSGDWNTSEPILGPLTCEQVSRFGTTFISTIRAMGVVRDQADLQRVSQIVIDLLSHQNALFASEGAKKNPEIFANNAELVGFMAICMAGICANARIDPRSLSEISHELLFGIMEMTKNTGPLGDDDFVLVDVKRNPDQSNEPEGSTKLQMALRIESTKTVDDIIGKSADAQKLFDIVKEVDPRVAKSRVRKKNK